MPYVQTLNYVDVSIFSVPPYTSLRLRNALILIAIVADLYKRTSRAMDGNDGNYIMYIKMIILVSECL